MDAQDKRYAALDGWRGIAALGVAAFHFGVSNHFFPVFLIRNAGPYVDFFFVLSGFVITHAYAHRLRGFADVRAFILRRFGRLWPLHIATLCCLVALEGVKWLVVALTGMSAGEAPFSGSAAALAIPAHLVFLQAFGIFHDYTWNGPSWSIGSEFWTYLVFAVVCLAATRRRFVITAGVMIASFVLLSIFNDGGLSATYDLGFFRCVIGFFAGAFTQQIFAQRIPQEHASRSTAAEAGVVALAIVFVGVAPVLTQWNHILSFLPLALFPAMIFIFAEERGAISRWLLRAPIQRLGKWSYSIYMVHFVVLTLLNSSLRVLEAVFGLGITVDGASKGEPVFDVPLWLGDVMFLGYLTIVIVLASLTWRFIEEPGRIYFNRLARHLETSDGNRRDLSATSATAVLANGRMDGAL